MEQARLSRLRIVALTEWIMVLPAVVFLTAAALRMLQSREYEPARTSWVIFEWTQTHVSRLGAAALFLVLPLAAAIVGLTVLAKAWHADEDLRDDARAALAILRQHFTAVLLTTATVVAAAIFVFAAVHVLTD